LGTKLFLASGRQGLELDAPDTVATSIVGATVEVGPETPVDFRELVRQALANPVAGPGLRQLAAGHRRVVVLVGDLSWPAPYPTVLPEICRALTESDIRPSRISFLCLPGASGPTLGVSAIRRYGEETVGQYELRDWTLQDGVPAAVDDVSEAADLRLAVLPLVPGARGVLPKAEIHFALGLGPGRGPGVRIAGARAGTPEQVFADAPAPALEAGAADVLLTTGGGSPTDATLEEALLGLRALPRTEKAGARSVVLVFEGHHGLGSARFVLDLWALLRQADEQLAAAGVLPAPAATGPDPWDPAGALADALCGNARVVLISPGLAEHAEGDELREELEALPALAARLRVLADPLQLWPLLAGAHGTAYRLGAVPLGWRGSC
jgi:hypothetical protein